MPERRFLPTEALNENIQRYTGRRILVKCHDGDLIEGRAGYYCEDMDFDRDEPDEEFLGRGIDLREPVLVNGEKLPCGMSVAFADIAGFLSLEGENTPEEIDGLFGKLIGLV